MLFYFDGIEAVDVVLILNEDVDEQLALARQLTTGLNKPAAGAFQAIEPAVDSQYSLQANNKCARRRSRQTMTSLIYICRPPSLYPLHWLFIMLPTRCQVSPNA